jgi:hypothetical protein
MIRLLSSKDWRAKQRQEGQRGRAGNGVEAHITIMRGEEVEKINTDRVRDPQKMCAGNTQVAMMNMKSTADHRRRVVDGIEMTTNNSDAPRAPKSTTNLFSSKSTMDMSLA